jgi:hypothetical protein
MGRSAHTVVRRSIVTSPLAVVGLFAACAFLPLVLCAVGPVPGVVGVAASALGWRVLGPRPVPGLVPGLLTLGVLSVDLAVLAKVALSAVR